MMKHSTGIAAAMLLMASCTHSETKPGGARTEGNAPSNRTLTGTVLEADGTPATKASVVMIGEGHWGGRHDYAQTDGAGKFSLQNVPQNEDVTLYASEEFKAGALKVEPSATDAGTLKLKAPASVSVTVHSADGAPIAGGRVYVSAKGYSAVLPNFSHGAMSFTGDHFDLPALPSGESVLHINVKGAGAVSDRAAHTSVSLEPGQHGTATAELLPATASISATVLDGATGKAIEATALLLEPDGTVEAVWHSQLDTRQAAFGGRTPGDRTILIEKVGYTTRWLSAAVPAGQDVSAGTASMVVVDPAAVARAEQDKAADEKAAADKAAAEAAAKLAKATISTTSSSADAIQAFNLGFDWAYSGHSEPARAAFQKSIELDPKFLLPQAYLAGMTSGEEAMKKADAVAEAGAGLPEAERTELQAYAAFKRGDTAKGNELMAKVVALAPADWRAQVWSGVLDATARKYDAATAAFQRAAELNPKAFSPHTRLSLIAAAKGDRETEIAEAKKAVALWPEAQLQDDLASAYLDAARYDDAVAALEAEEKMPGAGWEAHAEMSFADMLRGDPNGGVKEARAALEESKDPQTRDDLEDALAFAELTAKKHAEALKTLAAAEKESKGQNPNYYVLSALYRGLVQLDEGKHAAAITSLKEGMERVEKEPLSGTGRIFLRRLTLSYLAWAYAAAGKAADAQRASDALAKNASADAAADADLASMISFAQGEALLAKGDAAGAVAALSKCTPQDDVCREALVHAQEKAGDKAGAEATRKAYLALNQSGPIALWVRSRMEPPAAAAKKGKAAAK